MHQAAKMEKTPTLNQMETKLSETPDVRDELVAKFRFLIDTGRYIVSNLAVAEAMLDDGVFDDEMLGRTV